MSEDTANTLVDLQVKIAFVENTVAELDGVVRTMADDLAAMRRELVELRNAMPDDDKFNPDEEVPPHY